VATGDKNLYNHPITEDLWIQPGEILKITRLSSKFTLNNKKSRVELRYPTGKIASHVSYDKKQLTVQEDELYLKSKLGWQWVLPTPPIVVESNL
jgi:hypothetical protein